MYLVLNITNYDYGYQLGGVFQSYQQALKRLQWLEKQPQYNEEYDDSWRIVFLKKQDIKDEPYC